MRGLVVGPEYARPCIKRGSLGVRNGVAAMAARRSSAASVLAAHIWVGVPGGLLSQNLSLIAKRAEATGLRRTKLISTRTSRGSARPWARNNFVRNCAMISLATALYASTCPPEGWEKADGNGGWTPAVWPPTASTYFISVTHHAACVKAERDC